MRSSHLNVVRRGLVLLVAVVLSIGMGMQVAKYPPSESKAKAALDTTPRHGEWVEVKVGDREVRCWVVYPEVKEKAGVVIVIHEIYGLSDWIRGVTDQLAADGFIAIAPDLLSGKGPGGGGTESFPSRDDITKAVRTIKPDETMSVLNAVRAYGTKLPASNGKSATVGFCWGGTASFAYAIAQPDLNAAVVYYGTNPSDPKQIEKIKAPVLGLYGADDARVVNTIAPADAAMKAAGKTYTHHQYEAAGHGFLRQQDAREGANLKATEKAWVETITFLRKTLGN